jgi:hypothetical protein
MKFYQFFHPLDIKSFIKKKKQSLTLNEAINNIYKKNFFFVMCLGHLTDNLTDNKGSVQKFKMK